MPQRPQRLLHEDDLRQCSVVRCKNTARWSIFVKVNRGRRRGVESFRWEKRYRCEEHKED